MSSTRIGKEDEMCLYIKDASFMLPSTYIKSKAELEKEPHGGLASQSPDYVDDFHNQIELMSSEGDLMKICASDLFDLLLSISKEVKCTPEGKKIIGRLKKKIHKNY